MTPARNILNPLIPMAQEVSTTTLTLDVGIRMVVPDTLHLITPYVILEQGDWFEEEIVFVRALLRPGDRAIDIGANYGLYALSMAQVVGAGGRVWAFEPAASTAALLSQSITLNGFNHANCLVLITAALSDHNGTARLATHEHAEMNALLRDDEEGQYETVRVETLDACRVAYAWQDIHFIKMDAEGAELDIIRGGERLLTQESPLIQYEIKAGSVLNLDLVAAFERLGYRSYRLIPGLNALAPFDIAAGVDGYLLNLFCCKEDTAAELARRGLLLASVDEQVTVAETEMLFALYHWRETVAHHNYGLRLRDAWESTSLDSGRESVDRAMALYLASCDTDLPMQTRWNALDRSLRMMLDLCNQDDRHMRLATLAAIACAYGARQAAVTALERLLTRITEQGGMSLIEPFLMPCARLENAMPDEGLRFWTIAGLLESIEIWSGYSSFYAPEASFSRLKVMQSLGFFSPAMARRLALVKARLQGLRAVLRSDRVPVPEKITHPA